MKTKRKHKTGKIHKRIRKSTGKSKRLDNLRKARMKRTIESIKSSVKILEKQISR